MIDPQAYELLTTKRITGYNTKESTTQYNFREWNMRHQVRAFYAAGAVLLAVLGSLLIVVSGRHETEAQTRSLYAILQAAGADGDEEAAHDLSRLHESLSRRRLAIPPEERDLQGVEEIGGARIRLRGREPFALKLYTEPQLTTLTAIERYVSAREQTLRELVDEEPSRRIEVSISPSDYLPIETLWRLKVEHGLDIDAMLVAFYVAERRHSFMWVSDPREAGEPAAIDFEQPVDMVRARLLDLIPDRALAEEGISPEQLAVRVAWVQGTVRATEAVRLHEDPLIMLVDPISDILDAYQGRALEVEVVGMPQLLIEREILRGGTRGRSGPVPAGRLSAALR